MIAPESAIESDGCIQAASNSLASANGSCAATENSRPVLASTPTHPTFSDAIAKMVANIESPTTLTTSTSPTHIGVTRTGVSIQSSATGAPKEKPPGIKDSDQKRKDLVNKVFLAIFYPLFGAVLIWAFFGPKLKSWFEDKDSCCYWPVNISWYAVVGIPYLVYLTLRSLWKLIEKCGYDQPMIRLWKGRVCTVAREKFWLICTGILCGIPLSIVSISRSMKGYFGDLITRLR